MIAIVDSGSTKSEWAFVSQNQTIFATADGINPTTQTNQSFKMDPSFPRELLEKTEKMYFYGAGIKSEESKTDVKIQLRTLGCVREIEAMSDLLGAARACSGHQPGLVGILGTGSNICSYDGTSIHQKSPALGYILGDEGSGFQIGKAILKSYFYGNMPSEMKTLFEKKYNLTLDGVLLNTYKKPGNNAYIASFAGFLQETNDDWTRTIVKPVFKDFFDTKVVAYTELRTLSLNFVGSIAFIYQDILKEIIEEYGWAPGKFIQKHLENLVFYHCR